MASVPQEESDMSVPQSYYQNHEVSYMDIQRRPKFSKEELEALVTGITTHRDALIPPNGAPSYRSTNVIRQNCWKDILAKVNAVADPEVLRTLPEIVKRWRYLKSRTRVKARRLTKWDKALTDLQQRIMALVGDREIAQEEDNDEDGWDEVYEIDVGDVTVEDAENEDGVGEQDSPVTNQQSTMRYVTTAANVVSTQPIAQSSTHVVNNVTHNNPPPVASTPLYQDNNTVPLGMRNGAETIRSSTSRREDQNDTGRYGRAPSLNATQSFNQEFRYPGIQSERQADKSNVNITVQSCSCHGGNPVTRSTDEQRLEKEKERLEVERQRLGVEKQRLEVEKARLAVERERLEMERTRIAPASSTGAKIET